MLRVMRDSFHRMRWLLIAVVLAVVVGFVFIDTGMGGGGTGFGSAGDRAFAARVNGETITFADYTRAVKNVEDMYRQMYGQQFTPEMSAAMGLPKQVLDSLIEQRLLLQEAGRMNLDATQEEVRAKLLSIPTFNQDGKFVGMELYNRYVTGPLGYASAAAFEQDLAREITLGKIDSALMNSVVVSPKAAEAEYRRTNENARIRYVLLDAGSTVATINVTPGEVEDYYRKNQAKYAHGEQRKVRYLLADYARLRGQAQPTEQELRQYYATNGSRYRTPAAAQVQHILIKSEPGAPAAADAAAKSKAESIVAQLRGGADFAQVARANSEDPSSAGNGGDMGWVEKGQTVDAFEQAIFSVPLNTISDPIRTQEYGYHIVKVTERREDRVRPFEEVRGEIATALSTDKSREQAVSEINRIGAIVKQNKPANVQAFVNLANDKVTSNDTGWFGRGDAIEGIGNNPQLQEWIFAAKPGDVSDVVGTSRGPAILFVENTRPAGTAALTEIRQRVENDLKMERAREAARGALAQQLAGATSIDAIAQQLGTTVREATVTSQNPVTGLSGDTSQLVASALAAPVNQLQGPVVVGNGAVAFEVAEQRKVTPQELEMNRTTMMDNLRGQQARTLRSALLQRLRKEAEVEVNDELTRPTTTPAGV